MRKADIKALLDSTQGRNVYNSALQIIKEYSLEKKIVGGVLVGFSGGADSVMLLSVLKKYSEEHGGIKLVAVHVNHMIRGAEAERDEEFSREFCGQLDVEFIAARRDIPAMARDTSRGLEEAAREARYAVFADIIRGRQDVSCIAVAHNATDNLETMVFNMMRGAGTRGMAGISPVRDDIIRPIITVAKRDITSALDAFSIPYVTDSTNLETDYTRNFIRAEIIPKLFGLSQNPEAQATRASFNLRSDDSFIESFADEFLEKYNGSAVPRSELATLHLAVLFRVIQKMARLGGSSGVEHNHVMKIRELLLSGGDFSVSIPGARSFICRSGECLVDKYTSPSIQDYTAKLTLGINDIEEIGVRILLSQEPINNFYSNVYKFSIQQTIDFDIIKGELLARPRREGDSYVFGGMTRKLKKLFNDKDIPPNKRGLIPVICDEEGILWVPGFRVRDGGKSNPGKKLYLAVLYKA